MSNFGEKTKKLLEEVVRVVVQYRLLIIVLGLVLSYWSIRHTVSYLEFQTGRNDLVDPDKEYIKLYDELPRYFKGIGQYLIVVEAPTRERAESYVLRLGGELEKDRHLFEEVFYRVDTDSLEGKKLLFLSCDELARLHDEIAKHHDFIVRLCLSPGMNTLFTLINEKASGALAGHLVSGFLGFSDEEERGDKEEIDLSFIKCLFQEMVASFEGSYQYRSFWGALFGEQFDEKGDVFLKTEDDKFFFIEVKVREDDLHFVGNVDATSTIRELIEQFKNEFPLVDAGLTGSPALNDDEMISVKRDTLFASVIAFVGVALLFLYAFRAIKRPFLVVLSLLMGVSWTMGFLTLTVGHLNVLSVAFTPILIGLGIDFGIHILARYEEERAKGCDLYGALVMSFCYTVPGVIAGAMTTALAFFSMIGVQFRGIRELGFIAGSGVILTLLAMLTVLPALLSVIDQKHHGPSAALWKKSRLHFIEKITQRPNIVVIVASTITLVSLVTAFWLSFDYNILHLQARGTESVVWEKKLLAESERSSWYAISIASSEKQLRKRVKAFARLDSVHEVESILSAIPEEQQEKIEMLHKLSPYLSEIHLPLLLPYTFDTEKMLKDLNRLRFKMGKKKKALENLSHEDKDRHEIRMLIDKIMGRLKDPMTPKKLKALNRFFNKLLRDYEEKIEMLVFNVNPQPVEIQDFPESILRRFVSEDGMYLIRIYSKENIWERESMLKFVNALRSVDPDVTGPPVVGTEAIYLMKSGYEKGAEYALIAVFIVVMLLFRNVVLAIFALLPLFIGAIWLFALMVVLGVKFNLANIIVIPLLIGIAVDNGIHIVKRACEESKSKGPIVAQSTGKAVVLSSLTTMIGFGSLMVARHYGIFSLGLVLSLGIACVLIVSISILPIILRFYFDRVEKNQSIEKAGL